MATTAEELQEELEKAGLMELAHRYRGGEQLDAMCNRFVKARGGDRKKSFKMLKEYLEWCEKVAPCSSARALHRAKTREPCACGSCFNANTPPLVCVLRARPGRRIRDQRENSKPDAAW